MEFHPDGLLLGTGHTDGSVNIWDIRSQKQIKSLRKGNSSCTQLSFSEKGYHLAVLWSESGQAYLYDMRKNFQETNLELTFSSKNGIISFDKFGQFLTVAINNQIIFYGGKNFQK